MVHKHFIKLHSNERICLTVRKHLLIPVIKTFFWIVLLALILIFEDFLVSLLPIGDIHTSADSVAALIRTSFFMFAALGLLMVWALYYLNLQIVTNERIIDVNQRGLLHHEVTEFNIEVVQDATTQIKGLWGNIFNFGNVYVQTAGEQQNFVFDQIANPKHIANTVIELHNQAQGQ